MSITSPVIQIVDGKPAPENSYWEEGCAVERDYEREEAEQSSWAYWKPVANSQYSRYVNSKGNKVNIKSVIKTEGPCGEIVLWLYTENYKKQGRT